MIAQSRPKNYFNPRPPRGGRLYLWPLCLPVWVFQSTPPARGATGQDRQKKQAGDISIHAPREGGDTKVTGYNVFITEISIHAPREGGDTHY